MNMRESDFFEREAEGRRESLAHTLAAIHERLTVGQVLDEVLTYAKGSGGTFQSAVANAARRNPLPTMLIGTACALLLADKTGLSNRIAHSFKVSSSEPTFPPDHQGEEGLIKRAVNTVSSTAEAAAQRVRESVHDARDSMNESMASLTDSATSTQEQMGEMGDHAVAAARQTSESAVRILKEQPILLAGIGVALGAVCAFLLPRSAVEDRLMGESSDAVKGEVSEKLGQQLGAAKVAARDLAKDVRHAIEERGLSPAAMAGDALRNLNLEESAESERPSQSLESTSSSPETNRG